LKYPEVTAQSVLRNDVSLAHVVVISYHGKGPKKEDVFIDIPVSLDALRLVALTKPGLGRSTRRRGGEILLYGIHGRIARIALPRFTRQKHSQALDTMTIRNEKVTFITESQRMYDIHAVAEKNLADEYDTLILRAVARTAMKMAAAEGIAIGARAAAGKNSRDWVGPLVGGIARVLALATEEADIRSWRMLPGEIQLGRVWIDPGEYSVVIQSTDQGRSGVSKSLNTHLQIKKGETQFLFHQIAYQ